ncbi:MAG: DUF4386 domain-containing protein [Rhizomicrobium sp.]|jgi:hypothetical protein
MANSEASAPNPRARLTGFIYLLNMVTGLETMLDRGTPLAAYNFPVGLFAAACYVAVTLLLYVLFRPVNKYLSLIAMLFSFAGSAEGISNMFGGHFTGVNFLVFFGFYCVLIGYLAFRSTFMPRIIGVLLILAGLGYLTLLWPQFGQSLVPYNYAPGLIGEGALTFWLLARGVDTARWQQMVHGNK